MSYPAMILEFLGAGGSLFCAAAYVYGFVFKSKGDRRFHTASLLFTGMALGGVTLLVPQLAQGASLFVVASVVVFLLTSVLCQSLAAFRGRRGDRRIAGDELAERRALKSETPDVKAA